MSAPRHPYAVFYEEVSWQTLDRLDSLVTDDVRFKDPFSDVAGIEKYRGILTDMLTKVPDITFTVHHADFSDTRGVLRWTSSGTVKMFGSDPWCIEGMSEIALAEDGRVSEHVDFWDASEYFYARLPLMGRAIKAIQRRVGSH